MVPTNPLKRAHHGIHQVRPIQSIPDISGHLGRVGLCQNDHIESRRSDERRALPDVSARHTERHRVVHVKMPLLAAEVHRAGRPERLRDQ
jgi:hypothetical protein